MRSTRSWPTSSWTALFDVHVSESFGRVCALSKIWATLITISSRYIWSMLDGQLKEYLAALQGEPCAPCDGFKFVYREALFMTPNECKKRKNHESQMFWKTQRLIYRLIASQMAYKVYLNLLANPWQLWWNNSSIQIRVRRRRIWSSDCVHYPSIEVGTAAA